MKAAHHKLSFLNLVLFILSFVFMTVSGLKLTNNSPSRHNGQSEFVAAADNLSATTVQQLCEKNESENESSENDLQLEAIEIFNLSSFSAGSLSGISEQRPGNAGWRPLLPIYLSNHNLRI